MKSAEAAGIKVVANERYARSDSSVAGQVLKIVAARPDAVFAGNSGTPGALPYLALAERGYKGQIYGTHGLINADFVRVGGASIEGLQVPSGPVLVADQLPDSNPIKKVSMDFRSAYQKAQRRGADRCLLVLHLRRLPAARRCRLAHQGRARHAAVPHGAARCDRRARRSWWARTASTTSSPTTATAPTSARWSIVQHGKGPVEAGALTR